MKILIIRFSSIGDIVLTTPIIRCLKKQIPGCEIHFICKKAFLPVVIHNPYLDKIHSIESKVSECIDELRKEKFDYIIDLHHNLRSAQVKRTLGGKSNSFRKLNIEKWLVVNLKVNKLPGIHIVDRYFEAVKDLGVINDLAGLDCFIGQDEAIDLARLGLKPNEFHVLVAGGSYYTKRIPMNKWQEIIELSDKKMGVLGGKEDQSVAEQLETKYPGRVISLCGKLSINQSASVIQQADKVITSDTGLMHIAAAFKKKVYSLWGNTIPEFGMYPYLPGGGSKILEVKGLKCRPCSKLGYNRCPKGHFKCMNEIDATGIFI